MMPLKYNWTEHQLNSSQTLDQASKNRDYPRPRTNYAIAILVAVHPSVKGVLNIATRISTWYPIKHPIIYQRQQIFRSQSHRTKSSHTQTICSPMQIRPDDTTIRESSTEILGTIYEALRWRVYSFGGFRFPLREKQWWKSEEGPLSIRQIKAHAKLYLRSNSMKGVLADERLDLAFWKWLKEE